MSTGKYLAYIALWSVGFITVRSITAGPMKGIENFVAGNKTSGGQ